MLYTKDNATPATMATSNHRERNNVNDKTLDAKSKMDDPGTLTSP
jgi:hypothetical protein